MKRALAFILGLALAAPAPAQQFPFSIFGSSAASYDADAQAYFSAIVANGSTISAGRKAAVNTFIVSAKGQGSYHSVNYFSDLVWFNLMAADDLTGALVQIKSVGGNPVATNHGFSGGSYTPTGGFTGGSPNFIDSGIQADTGLTFENSGHFYYNLSSTSNFGNHGAYDGAGGFMTMSTPFFDENVYDYEYNSSGGGALSGAVTAPYGVIVATRRSHTAHEIYQNGVSIATSSTATTGTLPPYKMYVFARNNSGTADAFRADRLSAYGYTKGLTSAKVAALSGDLQRLAVALGRDNNTDDFFLPLTGQTPGAALTAAILNAGHAGTWGGVTMTDPSTTMAVAANGISRPSAVIVAGTTYGSGTGDLSFTYDHTIANQTLNFPVVINSNFIVMKCWIYLGPPTSSTFKLFDYMGAQFVSGNYSMLQLTTNTGRYAFNIETNPGGITTHTSDLTVTPATWVFAVERVNTTTGIAEATIYSSTSVVIGSMSGFCTTGTPISLVTVGNNEAGVSAGATSKFQSLRWSVTNPTYPVAP